MSKARKTMFARYTLKGDFLEVFPTLGILEKAGYKEEQVRKNITGHSLSYKNCLWRYVTDGKIPDITVSVKTRSLYRDVAKQVLIGAITEVEASIFYPDVDKSTLGNYVQKLRVSHKAEYLGEALYRKRAIKNDKKMKIHPKVLIDYSNALEVLEMYEYITIEKVYDSIGAFDTIIHFKKKTWEGIA